MYTCTYIVCVYMFARVKLGQLFRSHKFVQFSGVDLYLYTTLEYRIAGLFGGVNLREKTCNVA